MKTVVPKSEAQPSFVRLADSAPEARQIVLVPGHECPLITLDLPDGVRGQAREQVARRQLSDRLGLNVSDVEMRPFAPTASRKRGKTAEIWNRVLIADRERVTGWKTVTCRAVLPDYLSLPTADALWSVARDTVEGTEILMVRLGPEDGFSAAQEIALALLERALIQGPAPKAILYQGQALPALEALAATRHIPLTDSPAALAEHDIPLPGVLSHGELSCDLRRDPMAARARLEAQVLPWRWPLLAGTLAAALWSAAQMVAIDRIETQTARIQAETQALVETHFVTTGPVLDIRVQVSRILAGLRAAASPRETTGDPLELIGRTADVLAREQADPEIILYRIEDGLDLVLRLPDFAAAERVTARLSAAGLQATLEESSVSDSQSGVRTEIHIQRGVSP